MTIRDFVVAQLGGTIPLATTNRTVHAVDGATYRIELVWFRRTFGLTFDTPRLPRSIRIERARYARRLHLLAAADSMRDAAAGVRRIVADAREREAEKLAAGHRFETGDEIPSWVREIPPYVLEVRNGRREVYRRPVGEQRFAVEDGETEPDRSVEYPWVSVYEPRDGGPSQVACWSTDEGVFEHQPVTVTAVKVETADAHHAA
jgi:hypothetical protein